MYTLRGVYPNSGLAQAAVQAKLERLTRGTQTLNITLSGRGDLVAESKIYLSRFRSGIDSRVVMQEDWFQKNQHLAEKVFRLEERLITIHEEINELEARISHVK